jgi:hypothetical protein
MNKQVTLCNKYVDESMCELICAADGVESSATNMFQLNLMLNTWIGLGIDMEFPGWEPTLVGLLCSKGLTETVKICDSVFHALVCDDSSHGGELFWDACNYLQGVPSTNANVLSRWRNVSLLMRFAKRFTYDSDSANEACFQKFLEANRNCYSATDNRCKPSIKYSGKHTVEVEDIESDWIDGNLVRIIGSPKGWYPRWYWGVWDKYLEDYANGYDCSHKVYKYIVHVEHEHWEKVTHLDPEEAEGGKINRPSYSLIMKVREYVTDMVGEEPLVPLESFDGVLSSGSAVSYFVGKEGVEQKSVKTRSDKLNALYDFDPRWNHEDEGYFVIRRQAYKAGFRDSILKAETAGSPMIAVPKSMKERRLIKPEPVHRAYYASKVRRLLETQLISTGGYEFLPWDDQYVNQTLAKLGSAQMGYSTIDASAASDRQSRELTFMLVPEWLRPYLYNSITDYVVVNNQRIRVRCFSTSGNQLTWLMLGIVMRSIAEYGCSWYTDDEGKPLHAYAYGDDLIVPDVAYETVVELLELFGFVINRDKSFTASNLFRESCGGDFYAGFNVTPDYWRRGIVDIRNFPDTIAFVCNLQHKLYAYPTVRYYLRYVAYKLDPKITASPVGVECDDLWDGNVTLEESERLPHRRLKTCDPKDVKYSQTLMDHQYYLFLKYGRAFGSDVDRRFGISLPYLSPNLVAEPTVRWVLAQPPYYHSKETK